MAGSFKRPPVPKLNINKRFKTLDEFSSINKAIGEGFGRYIAELGGAFMQEYITQRVYGEDALGGASSYERTYDLINAVTVTRSAGGQWKVGIDGRKIHVSPAKDPNEWGQHAGIHGEPVASQMASYLEMGNDSPLYSYGGIEYIEETERYLNSIVQSEWAKFRSVNNI